MRLYVDASYDEKNLLAKLGIIIFGEDYVDYNNIIVSNVPNSLIAELFAVIFALEVSVQQGWHIETIFSDNQHIVSGIPKKEFSKEITSYTYEIMDEVRMLSIIHKITPFQWIPREKNYFADLVSRKSSTTSLDFSVFLKSIKIKKPCFKFLSTCVEWMKEKKQNGSTYLFEQELSQILFSNSKIAKDSTENKRKRGTRGGKKHKSSIQMRM